MIRKFINQEDLSNKFWNIEYVGKTQTVTYGKIGTKGRQTTKEFDSEEACVTASERLISQKLKKGYIEIQDDSDILEKDEISGEERAEIHFWEVIEKYLQLKSTETDGYDYEEHIEYMTEYLSKLSKNRIIEFEVVLRRLLLKLDRVDIAELSIILESPFTEDDGKYTFDTLLSGDGFLYFRCWIIIQGRELYYDTLNSINTHIEYIQDDEPLDIEFDAEDLLFVADNAYTLGHDQDNESEISDYVFDKYGEELDYDCNGADFTRPVDDGADLQKRYPELVEKVCRARTR